MLRNMQNILKKEMNSEDCGGLKKKVLILIDKATCHSEMKLYNADTMFLPTNTTSMLQLSRNLINKENLKIKNMRGITILDDILYSVETWNKETIQNCFKKQIQEFTNMDELSSKTIWNSEDDITNSDYIRYTVLIDQLKSMISKICPNSLINIYSIENEFHEKLSKKKRQIKIFEH
ncbi:hypothetical protein A3Q56_01671 [Intoshia linei]|uniref:Uncharacterized protein n=1 Tax=Intoshia linei TaxID=1819745 RepID=A0A177B8M7_9BILA|nr:hypothetical protein A3Q56_01671 [Intoshia linei]